MIKAQKNDKNIRKLSRIGNHSLGITIPIDVVRSLGWREKQKVKVKRIRGGIVVQDFRS